MVKSQAANERMRAESRAQILAAAGQLFAGQGFFNTKISDIARQAGMSQGNLYWYFPSKDEVLKAILQEGFEGYDQILAGVESMEGSGREKLDALVLQSVAGFSTLEPFFTILLSLMGHGGAPLLKSLGFDMDQIGYGYHTHVIPIFLQAQEEGIIGQADPNFQAMLYFSLFNGMLLTYREMFASLPVEGLRRAVYGLLGARGD